MSKIRDIASHIVEKYFIVFSILLFLVLGFAIFYGSWNYPVLDWDEARHAANAYEMIAEHNPVVNYYNGKVDYWNLKPPLSYWCISLSYFIFGYTPFAVRFYSCFSSLLGCIILFFYVKHKYGKISALVSILTFLGCFNLFLYHGVRSGDADALFMFLFIVGYVSLSLSSEKPNWIFVTGLSFSLMFLTKSFHALCFVPIVFFYLLFTKGFKNIGWWRLILFFVCSLAPILAWGIARYQYDGWTFFKKMWDVDIMNRTTTDNYEGHVSTPFYYIRTFNLNPPLLVSFVLCVVYLIMKIVKRDFHFSNEAILVMVSVLFIFGLFSIPKTRLEWYVNIGYIPLIIALVVLLKKY